MSGDGFAYAGGELGLFVEAHRWKAYLEQQVRPFIGRTVLEVGAGIGGTTRALCRPGRDRWVCLEPDAAQARTIQEQVDRGALLSCCEVVVGQVRDAEEHAYDTVLYIDVLEHIEDDIGELAAATRRLVPGGHIVVLSPAHPWLFSPFDRAIGHFRRYTRHSLRRIGPAGCELVVLRHLDAAGLLASWANRMFLRQQLPTPRQVHLWDRRLVPASRILDRLTGFRLGRTVLAVWRAR
jgi:2-polyprenyl-3-methyl-5-hydroxy-6-metoxy-1,4-benzoquinol methylase